MLPSERYAHIQLALTPYIGAESFAQLVAHFGSAQEALLAGADIIARLGRHGKQAAKMWHDTDKARAAADAALAWASQNPQCRLLLSCDDDYPTRLHEGITAPPLIFARGNLALLQRPAVGIVGSRHATPQAMRIAHDFAQALSQAGITVISGMAAGIDTAAHQGALNGSGSTIAVWGTGINRIYPQSNQKLAYQIAEQGLILSEFPLDTRPIAGNFPRRNRIIAAQSHAVLVVEAALESGSLITARQAAEMGREVMAIPGSIDNPHSKGCHKLIKEGAKLVECLDDIMQECPSLLDDSACPNRIDLSQHRPQPVSPLSIPAIQTNTPIEHYEHQDFRQIAAQAVFRQPENPVASHNVPELSVQHATLLQQMGYDPIHPDQLAERLQLPAAEIYAQLTELELDGHIAPLAGGRYQRIKKLYPSSE